MHRLTYPAPRRATVRTLQGFASASFSEDTILSTLSGGGWFDFQRGQHEFESDAVRKFAVEAQTAHYALLDESF